LRPVSLIGTMLLLAILVGCSGNSSGPDTSMPFVVGRVRLIAEMRDPSGIYYGESSLNDVFGVRLHIYSDGELVDSCQTSYGVYVFGCKLGAEYIVKALVAVVAADSVGPVTCTRACPDIADTLVLGTHGDISSYPNPFLEHVSIKFSIEEASAIELTVRGMGGEVVRTLAQGEVPAGSYTITWDGLDEVEARVPAGPYWAVLRSGDEYRYTLVLVEDLP
jgi:hypothetical protein